jgi:ribosomal-protein-alanine N-acetyltransferase
VTDRLELQALTAEIIDALLAADAQQLLVRTGSRFPEPVGPPPLTADALAPLARRLENDPKQLGWCGWLVVRRGARQAVGAVFAHWPDQDGVSVVGYTLYSGFERQGFATEAMRALLDWAFAEPRLEIARATVPPWHAPSLRVVERLGFRRVGTATDPEAGEVVVFELRRDDRVTAA